MFSPTFEATIIDDNGVWRLGDWSWKIPKKEV